MKNEVKRRDLLQTLAVSGSALALPGCGDASTGEGVGEAQHGLVVHPRAYVTTHTVVQGGALEWAASYGAGSSTARLKIARVISMSSVTNPQTDSPIVDRTVSLASTVVPYNGEEAGYGWSTVSEPLPGATPGLYAAQWSGDGVTWDGATVAYFVVRPLSRAADILLCLPFATTLAYAGGAHGSHLNIYDSYEWARTRSVSLDRPWDAFAFGEDKRERTVRYPFLLYKFIREMMGTPDVELCTSFDLHSNSSLLTGYKLFISAGHDEYWSKEMRDSVEAFVAAGGNAAYFSANTAWWQVRFSGRTMSCHKSSVEDSLAGSDNSRVTANFAGSPVNRPENTLTGVSYRRGVAFPSAPAPSFSIVAAGHPYFAGVAGATFGSSALLSYETDAVEYGAGFVPTGRDGSPTNLQVLAYADMSADDAASQKGQATMTRFTNKGIVFSAATTEWCNHLGDPNIAKITQNVVNALKATSVNPSWTLPARSNPSASWTTLDSAVGAGSAVAGIVQGHLLSYGTSFRRRDPETPSVGWSATSIPSMGGVKAMASDLLGRFVYAGTTTGNILRRSSRPTSSAPWAESVAPPVVSAACLGLGVLVEAFALFAVSGATLYRRVGDWNAGSWDRIGAPYPTMKTITALDSNLFGVSAGASNDDLWCRESSPIDLVWTKIGTMPTSSTLAIAGYYGRLFALTGTTANATLRWRAAIADSAGMFKPPSILFLNGATSQVGTLTGNGDFDTTGTGGAPSVYTMVVRANNGLVFFYHANGSAAICRYNANGTRTTLKTWAAGSFGAWTHIAYASTGSSTGNNEKVIFYNSSGTADTYIGRFDTTTGDFITEWSGPGFAAGWTHITCTHAGKLCFYNASAGTFAWGAVSNSGTFTQQGSATGLLTGWQAVVPAGNRYLFFYNSSGAQAGMAALAEVDGTFVTTKSWAAGSFGSNFKLGACANGTLLFYNSSSGAAVSGGFSASTFFNLRAFPAGAFATGWTTIVPLPRLT